MRRLLMSLLFTACYNGAATAETCMQPAEQQAFHVIALKSSLMVGALSCSQSEQYDDFMTRFQPHVLAEQHVVDKYFRRAGGLAGQVQEDGYVTLLANTQSQAGIAQGAGYCRAAAAAFQQVLGFDLDSDLDHFAASLPIAELISMTSCEADTQVAAAGVATIGSGIVGGDGDHEKQQDAPLEAVAMLTHANKE